jgi:hypothetical protein
MKPQLERLVKAFDAYMEAEPGPEGRRLQALYRTTLEQTAEVLKLDKEVLERNLKLYYPRWLRAGRKFPTIPPKA